MNKRLRELRMKLNLSQEMFGKKLGVTKSAISRMELETYSITDTMLKLICSNFNVNEKWLRTGDGDMFNSLSKSNDLFISNVFTVLEQLSDEEWALLKRIVDKLK